MDNEFQRKILMIGAESVARPFAEYFRQIGYSPRTAETLAAARQFLMREKFDAVICELSLPDGEAGDLFGECPAPVIVYSAETSDEAVVRDRAFTGHGITLNITMRTALYGGKPIKLTSSEFNILCFLMAYPGKFFSADEIYERVWKSPSMQTSVVRFHISNLKRTLLAVTGENLILTEFGTGYAFAAER